MSLMMEEILSQPQSLARTLDEERGHALEFRRFARRRRFRLVLLVARGTSDNAAVFGRYLLELNCGIPAALVAPSLYTLYHVRVDLRRVLVVGISQSGKGPDVNWVLESARRQGAYTVAITNEARSPITHAADEVFLVRAGRERSVAATKTYTGQLLLLYLLASALGEGVTLPRLSAIPDRAERALGLAPQVRELAGCYRAMRHCAVVARGLHYANAFEWALKLMETCYVVAERFSAADFLHGPIAMIDKDFPVLLLNPPGKAFGGLTRLAQRLRRLRADTLMITSEQARVPAGTRVLRVPGKIAETYSPIPYIIPGQLFAALLAEAKGLDPDRPRSLHKVTQTI